MPVDWFFGLKFLEFFEFVPKCDILLFPVKLPLKLCSQLGRFESMSKYRELYLITFILD